MFLGLRRIELAGPLAGELWSHVRMVPVADPDLARADIALFDGDGRLVGRIEGFECRRVQRASLERGARPDATRWLYERVWEAAPAAAEPSSNPQTWLLLSDRTGVGDALAGALERRGHAVVTSSELDPLDAGALRSLVERALADPARPLAGVVQLWALDARDWPQAGAHLDEDVGRVLGGTLHLVQALAGARASSPPRLLLVTRGVNAPGPALPAGGVAAALCGLARVVAGEHPELRCRRIDLPDALSPEEAARHLLDEAAVNDGEVEVLLRDGHRLGARLARAAHAEQPGSDARLHRPPGGAYSLEIETAGVLERLRLVERRRETPGPGQVAVNVHHGGLNFRDVMNALGAYPGALEPFGRECVGRVTAVGDGVNGLEVGDRVVVGLTRGAFGGNVLADARFVAPVPPGLTGRETVSLPMAFLTASYGLLRLARLRAGERVLVHAGAGGVGLAAIQIARRAGAEVLATAGSPRKRAFLRQLGVNHVFDSRSLAFADEIRRVTEGRGVNVVLNSLAGDFVAASLSVLGAGGRFIELGKVNLLRPEEVPPGVEYHHFDLGDVCKRDDGLWRELWDDIAEGLAQGALRPLPVEAFPIEEAVAAFRHMAQGRHVGKVVLDVECPPEVLAAETVRTDGSYLVTGGLGGLGLRLAGWLLERGAGHVVLLGRRAPDDATGRALDALEAPERITVLRADVGNRAELAQAFAAIAAHLPPLRGVVHAAGVLEDGVLQGQPWSAFQRVLAPKVRGAWNLHELTAGLSLDFFALFSSLAAVLGGGGQGAYAAGNAFLDGLAHFRRAHGLPATSIQWGPWAEVGMAAADPALRAGRLGERGVQSMTPDQALDALAHILDRRPVEVAVARADWARVVAARPHSARLLSKLARDGAAAQTGADRRRQPEGASRPAMDALAAAPASERPELLRTLVIRQVRSTMGLDDGMAIELDAPLKDYGLDSLMAVELRNRIGGELKANLPSSMLFDHPSVQALTEHLLERLDLAGASPEPAAPVAAAVAGPVAAPASPDGTDRFASIIAAIEALSDEDQELLVEKLAGSVRGNP